MTGAGNPPKPTRLHARARRALRGATGRPRLLVAAALAFGAVFLLPDTRLSSRFLMAYDIGVVAHIVLVWTMMTLSSHADLQRRADQEDVGAVVVLVLTVAAALVSLVAIGAELHGVKAVTDNSEGGRIGLAAGTILLSWLFVHTIFALHYAHDFYAGETDREGLKFPGEHRPDYWDFMYFSFNLGAAAQTSDVQIESARTRRFVLAHTILSFLFNTTVLALAINVGASLL
ncbi:MAG: hypothetical protein JWR08_2223 [Enterovirga sp.]|jgi:uncharacterized membrane protein|nr:hypothetical protein [Enterovirga sp.]